MSMRDSDKSFGQSDPAMATYAIETFAPEDAILREVRARSRARGLPEIQVGPMDGLHLEILMRLIAPRRVVEIGSLGGYSAICILRGMPEDGRLFALELSADRARLVEEHAGLAGFGPGRIRALAGPALDNLKILESEGPFDAVFIDADKNNYPRYLAWAADNLRLGGVAIGDNTFAWGTVGRWEGLSDREASQARSLDEFNRLAAAAGGRFRATILPTAEGLTVAVKIR